MHPFGARLEHFSRTVFACLHEEEDDIELDWVESEAFGILQTLSASSKSFVLDLARKVTSEFEPLRRMGDEGLMLVILELEKELFLEP